MAMAALLHARLSALDNEISLWNLRMDGRPPSFSFKPHFAAPASGLSEVHGLGLLVLIACHL